MLEEQKSEFQYTPLVIKIIAVILALTIFFVSKYVFIFFTAAMLPTVGSIMIDRGNKCASATVCTFNLIGVLPFLYDIFSSGSINHVAKMTISNIYNWCIIYTAAFVGQLLIWILPGLIAKLYLAKSNIRISLMEQKRDAICEEWGIDLKKLIKLNQNQK